MNPILEELEAQLESHGVDALEFTICNDALGAREIELVVDDVMFQDDKIKVRLALDQF